MPYHKDSEGNWAEEIPFSNLEVQEVVEVVELFTEKNSVFHREPPTEEETKRKEKRIVFVQMALGFLTPKQREVIVLSFNHHKLNREIAEILNISEQAVSERKRQALKKLRKILMGK